LPSLNVFFLQEPPGDILVFLTGQDDIDGAVKMLNEEIQQLGRHYLGNFLSP
jgi:ATP-dependent RNA helicase DDX35